MSEVEDLETTAVKEETSPPHTDPVARVDSEDTVMDKSNEDSDQNIVGKEEDVSDKEGKDGGKDDAKQEADEKNIKDLEKQEEAKLRAKYPDMKGHGASSFLQKRLSKGNKYFDSGDYNMAKAKVGSAKPVIGPGQKVVLPGPTGDAIPTPETVPHKKISNIQSKLVNTHLS